MGTIRRHRGWIEEDAPAGSSVDGVPEIETNRTDDWTQNGRGRRLYNQMKHGPSPSYAIESATGSRILGDWQNLHTRNESVVATLGIFSVVTGR